MARKSPIKPILIIASIFSLRMLGLFMIMPVFTVYAQHLKAATPHLIGLALGIYGLSQAFLQLPLGMSSDRFGRKPILIFGLGLLFFGSLIAGFSSNIYGIIIGRFLQGAGAIGSTLIATTADLTDEKDRTKAMAILGISIGLSFSLAFLLGPILASVIQVSGIFFVTALLSIIAIITVLFALPHLPSQTHEDCEAMPYLFKKVLTSAELLRLDLGIFIQHAILTANFVILPLIIHHDLKLLPAQQWQFYLPILLFGFFLGVPLIMFAEKKKKMKPVFLGAIGLLAFTQISLAWVTPSYWTLTLLLGLFFTGFNALEATLPSLISKAAPKNAKGTAMGVYSTAQFLGIFFGGTGGGLLLGLPHNNAIFYATFASCALWLLVSSGMHILEQATTPVEEIA